MAEPSDSDEPVRAREGVRLQKLLAEAGVDSRRKCEEYVVTGRVTVDGEVVTDPGFKADPETQDVRLDGERVRPQKKRYYLLNKPPGYISTNYDPSGRPRAIDLVPTRDVRLFSVGRLDESSQGLLLVTNDGEVTQRLAHPRFQVPRVYRVQVAGVPTQETLAELRKGVHFAEGKFRFNRTKRLKTQGQSAFLEVELRQGQNREIRRLFARFGHKVIWLQRVAFGPLKLGDLPLGRYRPLKPEEIRELHAFVRGGGKRERDKPKSGLARPVPRERTEPKRSPGVAPKPQGRRIIDLTDATPKPAASKTAAKKTGSPAKPRKPGGQKPGQRTAARKFGERSGPRPRKKGRG